MSAPLIDAQALGEFLDKAEPVLTSDFLRDVSRILAGRTEDLRAGNPGWPAIWQRAPASRRVAAEERGRFEDTLQQLWPRIHSGDRVDVLRAVSGGTPEWVRDWATYWLHVRSPEDDPWWSRWSYRPQARTGALLLVLDDPASLEGLAGGECYRRMAESEHFLREVMGSTRRLPEVDAAHAPTVALAAVYAVYMFTMASWRMTPEFTQALPPFPNVVRTLLGIDRWEWSRVGTEGQVG